MDVRRTHIAGLILVAAAACAGETAPRPAGPEETGWRVGHARLGQQRDGLAADLEHARTTLLERVGTDEALVRRLQLEPVVARESGYGVLPEIEPDEPLETVELHEQRYALEELPELFGEDLRQAAWLAARVDEPGGDLESFVAEFERLHERLGLLEDHLGYHDYWQVAVVDYPQFFAQKNRVVAQVREFAQGGAEELRRRIVADLAPFQATPGLQLEQRADGLRVLPVTVSTDIDDREFLESFRQAVEAAFADSTAAREARFAVKLTWRQVSPQSLYPDGPPRRGETLDTEAHVARFGDDALVLTTGEASTYAWTGRAIVLGPHPLTPRTLAHEFGHLLGFNDAYLRGHEGKPSDPYGVVLVEWTGLSDDLMGGARGGRVTGDMVHTLLEAYAPLESRPR